MKLLFISELFPPLLDSESLVAGKLVQALAAQGVEVETVAGDFAASGVKLSDSPAWQDGMGVVTRFPTGKLNKKMDYLAKFRLRNEVSNAWSLLAYRYCRKRLSQTSFDLIFSRTCSVYAMIVAYNLAQRPSPPWVLIMNDPYPEILVPAYPPPDFYQGLRQAQRKKFTRKALQASAATIFPCIQLQHYMEKILNLDLGPKSFIVPHIGWGRPSQGALGPETKLNILHCGRLDTFRSSEFFLSALHQACTWRPEIRKRVRIHQIGLMTDRNFQRKIEAFDLGDLFVFQGQVGYEESLALMAAADALLLVESVREQGIFFPSKAVDYAMARRPMLMFSPDQSCIAELVGGHLHPGFLGQGPETAARRLLQFITRWEQGAPLQDYLFPEPNKFSPAAVADRFIADLQSRFNLPGTGA